MPEIAGAIESLVVYRQKAQDAHDFHIHWKTTNGKLGCKVKTISHLTLNSLKGATLARIGLTESALTGSSTDENTLPKIILNFQRDHFGKLVSSLDLSANIHVLATLPVGRHTIEIPISDRSFSHSSNTFTYISLDDVYSIPDDEDWKKWLGDAPTT